MIKINISFSKKVPGAEQYSSLSFHGSMEKELSDGLSPEQIKQVFNEGYKLLESTVETEIQNYKQTQNQAQKVSVQQASYQAPAQNYAAPVQSPTATQNDPSKASQKQITFLNRLGADRNLSQQQIDAMAMAQFGAQTIWQLTKKQASDLIEQLQKQRAA